MAPKDDRSKGNLRLALILATVALVFFLGFVGRMILLGR
ncbi:cytochrome oxidase small assembly protein [Ramlibacter sp. AN1133]